ncbi:hypothetical protein [Streptomyces chartreusis]|uniref:hypothetical protein n=1 Tax=Streptomyces chartreusis TaxID=1969 RepID=UPI00362FF43C
MRTREALANAEASQSADDGRQTGVEGVGASTLPRGRYTSGPSGAMLVEHQGERMPERPDAARQDDLPDLHALVTGIDRDGHAVRTP